MKRPSLSIGIEEEYQTIDPETRDLRSHIQMEILSKAKLKIAEKVKPEMHQAVVEVGSKVCRDIKEAREDMLSLRREMISLATETDRTLFFDFLPLDLGTVRGFKTRFHLYTVPGQVFYDASRKLILKGVDGVVFVADSQEARMDANVESLQNLEKNLAEHGFDLQGVPYVLQLNKRDLPTAMPAEELYRQLNFKGEPTFEATAPTGYGVFDTLKAVAKQVLMELRKK